jgi:hypothetical protein
MTCLLCKNDSVEGHCPRTKPACSWYRCDNCRAIIDVARRLAWLPGHQVVVFD